MPITSLVGKHFNADMYQQHHLQAFGKDTLIQYGIFRKYFKENYNHACERRHPLVGTRHLGKWLALLQELRSLSRPSRSHVYTHKID